MIIGIDLGTTNSAVAYFKDGGPVIIPNRLGKHLTPSVVSVDEDGQIFVGETAKERMNLYPEQSAHFFKRNMGSTMKYQLGSRSFMAEELSSFILRTLKEDAEAFCGEEVTEAIISVPAYFDEKRRKATKRAGQLAGLNVERIISEPTAAAVAYGLYENDHKNKFLVFDLGGGTFDVSILEMFDTILEVRAVAGDNYLGGEDFTEILLRMFLQEKNIEWDNLNQRDQIKLMNAAEECKLGFSERNACEFTCTIGGKTEISTITLEDYQKNCELLLERIRKPVQRSLNDAGIKLSDIDEIVMIGGATRLPIVRNFIVKLFQKFPDTNINPDEAVALGAAVQAAMKSKNAAVKEVILTDVCSFTLGTEVSVTNRIGQIESGHYCSIIERNTIIPASRTERLYTIRENQDKVTVRILQGESRFAANNLYLGELTVEVPKNKAGEEAIDVTYTYDINAILEVVVKVISTGYTVEKIIKSQENEMTDEEIKERMTELAFLKIHPREQEENKLLMLKAERLYEACTGQLRNLVDRELQEFELLLDGQEPIEIRTGRERLKQALKEIEESLNNEI